MLVYNFNVVARMLSMPNGQKNRSIEVPPLKLSIFTSISILYTVCTISLHPFDINLPFIIGKDFLDIQYVQEGLTQLYRTCQ